MKYKNAKVISHPRAGSHYLARILNLNFFHLPNYLPLYAGHSKDHIKHLKSNSTAVFYIYRNVNDSVISMFNLRRRFGLTCTDLATFMVTPLGEMHNTNIHSKAIMNTGNNKTIVTAVDTALSNVKQTPVQYIEQHKIAWTSILSDNFISISYDDLMDNFKKEMKRIGSFLGSDRTTFINETKRVGWYDIEEPEKIFT